ncbi:MAG: septum formation protein Maf [Deltaproteobacteria bacterium]|nr:septum formation protein Maf [Deltaproteobacteria bacterium]
MLARIGPDNPLLLGSQSPRRRQLLEGLGIPVEVFVAPVDEALVPGERPDAMATRLARQKGAAVLYALHRDGLADPPRWILCADTIVHIGGELLGKPRDVDDARRMMRLLSGRTHHVTTGFVLHGADAFDAPAYAETTAVTFRALSEDEVRRYAATGEGADKAGGYAIQGLAAAFVERIEGSYSNVVGLPLHRVVEVLLRTEAIEGFPL